MLNVATQRIAPIRAPKVAALMLFFLGLSTNGQLDLATSWPIQNIVPQPVDMTAATPPPPPLAVKTIAPVATADNDKDADVSHVLSIRDAEFYRGAFIAQEKLDWKTADELLARVKDKRLIGHVLADRYMRRPMTLAEAQQWMASYADLPEAATLYDDARHQHGFATAHIAPPVTVAAWTGNDSAGSSYGFRALADDASAKPHADEKTAALDARITADLRRGDPMAAHDLLTSEMQRGTLSATDTNDMISRVAAAFFYQGQIERARPLAHIAANAGVPLGLWIDGLSAWKQKDFEFATRSFASLAQAPTLSSWDRSAAAYWAYRAAKHTGDAAQSRHWLAEAAKYPRSFYGYIAANVSGHRPSRSWKLPELTAHHIEALAQRPAGWQALALVQVGRNDLAESELRRLNPHLDQGGKRDVQTATLALAEKAHMPSLTLQMGGVATNDNGQIYEAALYPLPPWQPVSGFKVDRALIYALMKRESQFDPEAVSQSGACGLMQIMPSTAHEIAGENAAGGDCTDRLFDPATNMELGQKYVRALAGQPMIGDNLMLLLAAYNGGPGNVAHWLDGEDRSDPLLFLESMPVRETHDYVQQVLMHYWMYRSRLANPENSVAQLARGEWPRYALRDTGAANLRQATADGLELAER